MLFFLTFLHVYTNNKQYENLYLHKFTMQIYDKFDVAPSKK